MDEILFTVEELEFPTKSTTRGIRRKNTEHHKLHVQAEAAIFSYGYKPWQSEKALSLCGSHLKNSRRPEPHYSRRPTWEPESEIGVYYAPDWDALQTERLRDEFFSLVDSFNLFDVLN